MLRYAVFGLISLVASNALAQQPPPPDGTPAAASSPASTPPAAAAVPMEAPLPGDKWTYEERYEMTGRVPATYASV